MDCLLTEADVWFLNSLGILAEAEPIADDEPHMAKLAMIREFVAVEG